MVKENSSGGDIAAVFVVWGVEQYMLNWLKANRILMNAGCYQRATLPIASPRSSVAVVTPRA